MNRTHSEPGPHDGPTANLGWLLPLLLGLSVTPAATGTAPPATVSPCEGGSFECPAVLAAPGPEDPPPCHPHCLPGDEP